MLRTHTCTQNIFEMNKSVGEKANMQLKSYFLSEDYIHELICYLQFTEDRIQILVASIFLNAIFLGCPTAPNTTSSIEFYILIVLMEFILEYKTFI